MGIPKDERRALPPAAAEALADRAKRSEFALGRPNFASCCKNTLLLKTSQSAPIRSGSAGWAEGAGGGILRHNPLQRSMLDND
jgi:hypothetical protein